MAPSNLLLWPVIAMIALPVAVTAVGISTGHDTDLFVLPELSAGESYSYRGTLDAWYDSPQNFADAFEAAAHDSDDDPDQGVATGVDDQLTYPTSNDAEPDNPDDPVRYQDSVAHLLKVRVAAPKNITFIDENATDVVPIETIRRDAPWDERLIRDETSGSQVVLDYIEATTRDIDYVTVDGGYVHGRTRSALGAEVYAWEDAAKAPFALWRDESRKEAHLAPASAMDGLAHWMGSAYGQQPDPVDAFRSLPDRFHDRPVIETTEGRLGDTPVYGITRESAWEPVTDVHEIACDAWMPGYRMRDAAPAAWRDAIEERISDSDANADDPTRDEHAGQPVWARTTRQVWLEPRLSLPIITSCRLEVVDGRTLFDPAAGAPIDDDDLLARIDFQLALETHVRGHTPIPVEWDPDAADPRYPYAEPTDTHVPGLPKDGDTPRLRIPSADVHAVIHDSDDANLEAFLDEADGGYRVVWAAYTPDLHCKCLEDDDLELVYEVKDELPDSIHDAFDRSNPPSPNDVYEDQVIRPVWFVLLESDANERIRLEIERVFGPDGEREVEPLAVYTSAPWKIGPGQSVGHLAPETMTTIGDVFRHWEAHDGGDFETWQHNPSAWLYVGIEDAVMMNDDPMVPAYRFSIVSGPEPIEEPVRPGETPRTVSWPTELHERGEDARTPPGREIDDDCLRHSSSAYLSDDASLAYKWTGPIAYCEGDVPARSTPDPYVAALIIAASDDDGFAGTMAMAAGSGLTLGLIAYAANAHLNAPGRLPAIVERLLRTAPVLALFTKISRKRLLDHKTRDEIIHYVEANPGANTEMIRGRFKLGWGTVIYHLNALEQHTELKSVRSGRARRWFRPGAYDPATREALAALQSPSAHRLMLHVQATPGMSQQELAKRLGVTHGAVVFQVRKLVASGLIDKRRVGREVRYAPTEVAERALGEMGPLEDPKADEQDADRSQDAVPTSVTT